MTSIANDPRGPLDESHAMSAEARDPGPPSSGDAERPSSSRAAPAEPRVFTRSRGRPALAREADLRARLERGEVVTLPALDFELGGADPAPMLQALADRGRRVDFNPLTGALKGATGDDASRTWLSSLLTAYAGWTLGLLWERLPAYGPHLVIGSTRLRSRAPDAPGGRLRVEASPAHPVQGRRLLRVVRNIDPSGEPWVWRAGEPFADHARRFLHRARTPLVPAWLLQVTRLTEGRRSAYDRLMLGLRHAAEADEAYQAAAAGRTLALAPGDTWIAFTDATPHAVAHGRLALEQTFLLPVSALTDPDASPLRTLERMTGRRLA